MPNGRTALLNRAATMNFAVGETLSQLSSAYVRKIDFSEGASLTGFVATMEVGTPNLDPQNRLQVYLFEDYPFSLDVDVAAVVFEPFLMFNYVEQMPSNSGHIKERFISPYKLRFGHTYTLLARPLIAVAPVPPISVRLTAFGFENSTNTSYFGEAR